MTRNNFLAVSYLIICPSKRCYGAQPDSISKQKPLPPPAFQHGKKQFNLTHILEKISSLYLCTKDKVPECLLGFLVGKQKQQEKGEMSVSVSKPKCRCVMSPDTRWFPSLQTASGDDAGISRSHFRKARETKIQIYFWRSLRTKTLSTFNLLS